MGYPEFHYKWEWWLRSSPERLWPFVADTNRFNRDTGLPGVRTDDAIPRKRPPESAVLETWCTSRMGGGTF